MNSKELTDEWVEIFEKPENQSGAMWLLAKDGCLPIGVDEGDPRVKKILHGSEDKMTRRLSDDELKIAIRYGEAVRESLIKLEAFNAAAGMRDLLLVAYDEREKRKQDAEMTEALKNEKPSP